MIQISIRYLLLCTALIALGLAGFCQPQTLEIASVQPAPAEAIQDYPSHSVTRELLEISRFLGFLCAVAATMHMLCSLLSLPTVARLVASILLPGFAFLGWLAWRGELNDQYIPPAIVFAFYLLPYVIVLGFVSGVFAILRPWLFRDMDPQVKPRV